VIPIAEGIEDDEPRLLAELAARQRRHWPPAVPREPRYPLGEVTLGEMVREWARLQPDKPVVVFYGRELSYAELDHLSDRFAALLHAQGVKRGDRVAVMLSNCPQFHIAFIGILKFGAVHVPVNPMFREAELEVELVDSGATLLLVADVLAELALAVQPRTAVRHLWVTSLAEMLPPHPVLPVPASIVAPKRVPPGTTDLLPALQHTTTETPPLATDLDATAALNYTGGTTGMPKGCVHTQRDMVYTAASTSAVSGSGAGDVTLAHLAMFWIAGENAGLIYPLFNGGTVVLLARWDGLAAMAAIDHYRCNRAGFVVDNLVEIIEHPEVSRFDLRSLRATRCSSFVRKLDVSLRERWRVLTAGGTLLEAAWGMTETHTSDTFTVGLQPWDLAGQPVFVGLPMPGTRIKVADWDTGRMLPIGQQGEILVATPSLMKGYWQRPDATAEAMRGEWFRTGDIGVYDEMGFLHILGRRKEMLKVRGISVFPTEIEALLARHPQVLGSGVIGMHDDEVGERPVAFVLPRPGSGLTAGALETWCREQMAPYKVPQVRIVDSLPMTATGKVRKNQLHELL